jgi:hypothetical protein
MTAIFPLLLWLCQMILGSQCGCTTEGIVEHHGGTTYVGAISDSTEVSTGFTFKADGSITFENRAP